MTSTSIRNGRTGLLAGALVLCLGFAAPAVRADEPASGETPPATTEEKVDDLDQRLKLLERKDEVDAEVAAAKAKDAATATASAKDGFMIKSADGNFVVRIKGYAHFDGRFYDNDALKPVTDTFILRRVRPIVEGTVGKIFNFRIMPDFGGGTTVLQDAWVAARFHPWFKVTAGKFKTPFGIERLQSATDILFVERALPNNFVPNRDLGVTVGGESADGVFNYQVGIFNGVPDGGSADVDTNDSKDGAGRIFLHPFKRTAGPLQGLGIGLAATYGTNRGTPAATGLAVYRTTGQQTFFSYLSNGAAAGTVVGAGTRSRLSPQAYYYVGRFGFIGEYVTSKQEVLIGTTRDDLTHKAWAATASFLLTDDKAGYKQTAPKNPLGPGTKSAGAWEIKARYSNLKVDDDTFPTFASPTASAREAKAWGAGLNWYLTRNIKVALDYERTKFDGGGPLDGTTVTDREEERVFFSRLQLSF